VKGIRRVTKREGKEHLHAPDDKPNKTEKDINPATFRTASMQKISVEHAVMLAMIRLNTPREVAR
jgi:hypothetical protein